MNFPDYYAVLGLPRFYPTQEEIRDAFLKKLVELHVFSEAGPDLKQELNYAYQTLSDPKKKREYDEVLARYIEAQNNSEPEKQTISKGIVYAQYDSESAIKGKREWSVSSMSDKAYDFLFDKAEQLDWIIFRYPFTSELRTGREETFEISMLFLYDAFFSVYINDYTIQDIQRIIEDGVFLLSIYFADNDTETKSEQLMLTLTEISSKVTTVKLWAKQEQGNVYEYIVDAYILQMFDWSPIQHKIESPDFREAYLSMKRELMKFWEKFYTEKDFVT